MTILNSYWVILIAIAAVSHAFWNFFLKQSEDKTIFLWSLRIWAVILFFPLSIAFWPDHGIPLKHLLFWGTGSILLHGFYAKVLGKAYELNDFTLVYPIARGLGPLLTVFIGISFLGEQASIGTIGGVLLIISGMYILYTGWDIRLGLKTFQVLIKNPLPIIVGISIAGYTVFDKLAIAFIPAIVLNVIENAGQVLILSIDIRKKNKSTVLNIWKKTWYKMAIAGFLSGLSYILVLLVLTEIPVSKVAPIRESGIIIGALLGYIFLKEKFTIQKFIGSVVIFFGVISIVLGR